MTWEMRHNYLQSSIPRVQVYETSCCVSCQADLFVPIRRESFIRVVGMVREELSHLKSGVGIDASKNVEGADRLLLIFGRLCCDRAFAFFGLKKNASPRWRGSRATAFDVSRKINLGKC